MKHIIEPLNLAKESGLEILANGALFSWDNDYRLIGVSWMGAILWINGLHSNWLNTKSILSFPKGWKKQFLELIEEDAFWVRSFDMGFSYNQQINFIIDRDGKSAIIEDQVSKLGISLRKSYFKCR